MITRNTLRAIVMATTCLAPLAAHAADDDFSVAPDAPAAPDAGPEAATKPFSGFIDLGAGALMGQNANQAGRYNGLNTTGGDLFGAFDVGHRDAWDSGGTGYWDFNGANLNFQTGDHFGTGIGNDSAWATSVANKLANAGSLDFKAGQQGTWGVGVYFDSITYTGNVIDSLYSFNGNQGFLNNGLAPWGGSNGTHAGSVTSFTIPTLTATGAMQPFQTGTRRDIIGGNFSYIWNSWTFTGAFRHEHKEGTMEESFDGPYGGTAFGLPINYDTDRYDAIASYNTKSLQSIFQYTFSHFTDNTTFVTLPYPTSGTAAPFQRTAAYSTPPSNDAHYLTMMLASSDIIPLTRVNLNARVGVELQNNTFAPNTGDAIGSTTFTGLNPATLQGTSANSPEMMAEVYQVKVSATSHPLPDVTTRVFYGVDGRSVTLNQYGVNTSGTGGSSDSSFGLTNISYAVPQDWLKQNAGGEIGYRFIPESDTKVTLGYQLNITDRSNAQVGHSSTNTATLAFTSDLGHDINGKISFEYADRTGNLTYLGPWGVLAGAQSGQTYSGAYYQAPMTSEAVVLRADYSPSPVINGGLFLQFKNENYNYPDATAVGTATASTVPLTGVGQGIKQDYTLTVGPDINYRPLPNLNMHFFYTYELLFYNNTGNGACSTPATAATAACAGTVGYFQNLYTSTDQTIGISGDWKVNDKLKLKAEYTISYGSVMFGQFNEVFVANPTASYQNVANYPDINSLMNAVKLTSTYELMPNVELIGQAMFTSFHNNDWNDTANAIQGAGTSAISILTSGYAAPNYSVLALVGGIKLRF